MSGGERKRMSKWDLQNGGEQQDSSLDDDIHKNSRNLFEDRKSQPEFAAGSNNDPKWYTGAEANNEHGGEVLDASMPWDSDIKMSPDQRKCNRSPQSGFGRSNRSRSRSRSRSPSRSNFTSKVRPYLNHSDKKNPEDRRYSNRDEASRNTLPNDSCENTSQIGRSNTNNNNLCNNFLKGRCFRGETCRYSHHSSEDGISKGSSDEFSKPRENFSSRTNNESSGRGGPPCKFFASGNCRKGNSCHFSHNRQTSEGPDDVSRDDWRRRDNNLSDVKQRSESKYSHHHHLSTNGAEKWDGDSIIEEHKNELAKNPSLDDKNVRRYNEVSGIDLQFSSANLPQRQNSQNSIALLTAPTEESNRNTDSCQQPLSDGGNNTVSKEQISQLNNLSVSLAQFFGSGQQLPLLYAALNGGSNSVNAAAVAPDQTQKQYDPVIDNIDLNKSEVKIESTDKVAEKTETVANEEKGKEGNGNGNNGKSDEGKNGNGKGMRAFKFALVEFVKELLKPTWKGGQLSKEDHKIIVKKVVDKVTGSIQGLHIPQSQDKIDNYLSSSKPKLSKLVQAYVDKYHKS